MFSRVSRSAWIKFTLLAVVVIVVAVLSFVLSPGRPGANDTRTGMTGTSLEAILVDVVDGDTIRVYMPDGREEKVRYIGLDAPEMAHEDSPGEYLGAEAAIHNAELLAVGELVLETDIEVRDDFGRLLAYVWADDVFVNERMILDGYARARDYPPNLSRQDQLWEANDKARAAGVGIWAEGKD
jgi:micrococcal nuclease